MTGPRSEPPMPMLTTARIRSPVWPVHSPERTASVNSPMRSSTACTSVGTSCPSTASASSRGARSAVCSTARSSLVLMWAPENIASMRSGRCARARQRRQQRQRVAGDAVLGVVEDELGAGRGERLGALRIAVEELAQVQVTDRTVVLGQRRPLGGGGDVGTGNGGSGHGAHPAGARRRAQQRIRWRRWTAIRATAPHRAGVPTARCRRAARTRWARSTGWAPARRDRASSRCRRR